MKLDELHVGNGRAGAPAERHAIAGGGVRIGGVEIDFAATAGGEDHAVGAEHPDLAGRFFQHIGAEHAVLGHRAEFAGGDEVDDEMILQQREVGSLAGRLDERARDLAAGGVLGMQDAAVRVAALAP